MKTHSLYKDGSIDKFRNYPRAFFLALVVSLILFIAPVAAFGELFFGVPFDNGYSGRLVSTINKVIHFFSEFNTARPLKIGLLIMVIAAFILVFVILKKPLIRVKYPYISFYGNSLIPTKLKIPELQSISVSSDSESVTFDIRNLSGINLRLDINGVSYISGTAEEFIKKYTHIKPS